MVSEVFGRLGSCLPDVFPNDAWNSAEHWSAWFTVLEGQSLMDTRGRSCHCGGGHSAECHVLSCAETGCVSEREGGRCKWEHLGNIRCNQGQHGSKRSRETASLSLAIQSGEFPPHCQQDGCALLCSHGASVPGADRPCLLTLLLVNATTVPGKQHSCRLVTKAERPPQSNSCEEGPSNTNQCPRAQTEMYNLALMSLSLPAVKSPQKRL